MKTELFYFSGTGNSLAVAKDLAEHLGGARLRSMPAALKFDAASDADTIGLVFPVYFCGPPRLVNEFIEALAVAKNAYIFAVCTCGGSPGVVLPLTKDRLASRGLDLKAGFVIRMPGNYIVKYGAFPAAIQRWMLKRGKERAKAIARLVSGGRRVEVKQGLTAFTKLVERLYARILEQIPAMDGNFRVDEDCTGCRLCERVCPVRNITVADSKPEWHGRCQMCLACLQWCPAEAIQYGEKTAKRRRYRHPGTSADDLIKAYKPE